MMNHTRTSIWWCLVAVLALWLLASGCQTMEQKRDNFFRQGKELYEKGDYVRARLQLKNALQIDPKFAPAVLWLAKTELKLENPRGAFGFLNQAVELDPKLIEARIMLAQIYIGAKKFDEAKAQLQHVFQQEPKNLDALLLSATMNFLQGKTAEAKAGVEEIKGLDPKKYEVYLLGAQMEASQKNLAGAAQILDEGLKVITDRKELFLARAAVADAMNQPAEAEGYLQEAIKVAPKDTNLRAQLARLYVRTKEVAKAEEILRQQLSIEPDNEKHVVELSRFLVALNRPKEAEKELTAFLDTHPDNNNARFALAEFYLSQRQEAKSLATLQAIVDRAPTDPAALQAKSRMAAIHANRGRLPEAEKLVSEVLKENPKDMVATRTMGLLALAKKDGLNAVSNFRLLVQDQPQNPEARLLLARAHLLNKEKEQAREQAKKALELKPDYLDARNFLYGTYLQDKDYKGAIDTIQSYLRYNDKDLYNLAALGEVYAIKGDFAAAQAAYKKITSVDPKNPLGYFELARLELKQKKPDAAIPFLNEALARNPAFLPALQALTAIYLEKNQAPKAVEAVKKSLAQVPDNPTLLQMMGELSLLQKKPQEAIPYLEKALTRNPRQLAALRLVVLAYQQSPDQDKVAEELAKKAGDPQQPPFYSLAQAMYYEGLKDYPKAMEVYTNMIERNLFATLARNNLAYLLVNRLPSPENNQRALKLVTEALEDAPEDPNILDTKGWILFQLGDLRQAESYLRQATEIAPENPVIRYHLAATLAKLGETANAANILQKILETKVRFPDRAAAETLLLQLRQGQDKPKP